MDGFLFKVSSLCRTLSHSLTAAKNGQLQKPVKRKQARVVHKKFSSFTTLFKPIYFGMSIDFLNNFPFYLSLCLVKWRGGKRKELKKGKIKTMGTIKWHIGMNTKLDSQKPQIGLLITKEPNNHYEFHRSIWKWTSVSLDLLNSILPVKD